MISLNEARHSLRSGASIAEMAEAIAIVIFDPSSSEADIRLGLRHTGFVSEQAEFALRRRAFRTDSPVPNDGRSSVERLDSNAAT